MKFNKADNILYTGDSRGNIKSWAVTLQGI